MTAEEAPPSGSSGAGGRRTLLVVLGAVAGALAFYLGMVLGSSSDIPANTTVLGVQACTLDKLDITMLRVAFEFEDRPPLQLMIYAPKPLLAGYEPAEGDEIEAYVWLQGRIIDFDPKEDMPKQ